MTSQLPPNATQLERDLDATIGARFDALAVKIRDIRNPDTCPVAFLPWLAWAFSVDVWDADWPTTKRAAIKAAWAIHKKKGTSKAVRDAVAALGGSAILAEWWETSPQGTPNTFTVTVTPGGQDVSANFQNKIIDAVERTKRLSQDYTVIAGVSGNVQVNVLGYARLATFQRFSIQDAT